MVKFKKSKTKTQVTEIPNAKVTIEVEENLEKEPAEKIEETLESPESEEKSKAEDMPVNIGDSNSGGFGFKKLILTILIVVPIGFLVFGGLLFFSKNFNTSFLKKEPEKKLEIPEATPTPTEEVIDKEAYEIEVQNGSGIAGEGARVKEILDKAGFKTGAVGNADNSDYTDTIITVGSDVPDVYIEALTKILEERGPVGKVKKFALGEDGEVLVIVGSDLSDTTITPEK